MNNLAKHLFLIVLAFGLIGTGYAETKTETKAAAKKKHKAKPKTQTTGNAGTTQNKVTLNFANAEIGTVAKAMGEMTGRTIVVDPRVKGMLNLTTPKPVYPSVAYDIFLAALRMQGFASAEVNGMVRIVPEADVKFQASPLAAQPGRSLGEVITRVFVLKHKSAVSTMPALRPLINVNNTISADPGANALVVTDYADNMSRLEQIIANLDSVPDDDPILIPLRYASAQDIAALVNRVFTPNAQATGASELDKFDVAVDIRSNSLIVRGRSRGIVGKVQNLVTTLDVPTPMAGNVHVIYLKNAEAVKVAQTLRNILTADSSSMAQPAAANPVAAQPAGQSSAQSTPGIIQADSASNALIITAPEAVFNNLKAVIDKLDVRRAQVLVEALIAEVAADKAAQFGIQWMQAGANGLIGGFGNSGSNNIGSLATNPLNAVSAASQGFNLGAGGGLKTLVQATKGKDSLGNDITLTPAVQYYTLGVLATALQTDANANILSTPTLLTLDNEEAKISVGSNVPFQTGSYSVNSGTSASPFTTIERKDVGLILKVKPQISEGGTVRLTISEEVSSIQGQGGVLAATNKRSIDTTVLVDDGQIVVLGGLIEEQVQDTEDRVPLLGDIPLLGNLFRYSNRTHNKTNLMVFLRPKIIRDSAAAAAVTDVRYNYIVGVQKDAAPPHKFMLPDAAAPTLRYDGKLSDASPAKAIDLTSEKPAAPAAEAPRTAPVAAAPAKAVVAAPAKPAEVAPAKQAEVVRANPATADIWYQPVPARP